MIAWVLSIGDPARVVPSGRRHYGDVQPDLSFAKKVTVNTDSKLDKSFGDDSPFPLNIIRGYAVTGVDALEYNAKTKVCNLAGNRP